ncbi:integrin alpha-X-like, partial [Ascaphus truei]|uniref:integrin alpha-X-like n=1 Tax=Ascaphus truei TaxID=8439 RepID=UPI003F5A29D2
YALQRVARDAVAVGAPRYQHTGRVLIFTRHPTTSAWRQRATATGEKIGSYFGSVLCAVNMTPDLSRVLLLVGAPMYYTPDAPGGRVYLCPLPKTILESPDGVESPVALSCPDTLQGDVNQPFGHFGSAISLLPDLTGDQIPDLAVGAPCEDQNMGALYIFSGQGGSFRASYIQRIPGIWVSEGIMFFGVSVSGNMDLTQDGLPDLTVGAQAKSSY